MEEKKLCENCKKNHAARSHEIGNQLKFFCLECYSRMFLEEENGEEGSFSVCPYCGMTIEEVKKGKLVGCAHCYRAMQTGLYSMVKKMQGEEAHQGKTPPLSEGYSDFYEDEGDIGEEYRAKAVAQARYERQCRELEIIIEKLKSEGDFDGAKSYGEKLSTMRNRSAIEEDFVWRTRTNIKRP